MARISKEKQEQIRQKIKTVSRELFFELDFEQVSTKQIAKEVGIAEGTLFNYFDSKTEIFFEAFGDEYERVVQDDKFTLEITDDIASSIYNRFKRSVGMILKLPRGVLGEMAIASVKMAKKKPDRFRKLMEYDMQFIEEVRQYIEKLIEIGILVNVDSKQFSEMVFSIIGFELLLYMYDTSIDKKDMFRNTKTKLDILIKGYIKGGKQ